MYDARVHARFCRFILFVLLVGVIVVIKVYFYVRRIRRNTLVSDVSISTCAMRTQILLFSLIFLFLSQSFFDAVRSKTCF